VLRGPANPDLAKATLSSMVPRAAEQQPADARSGARVKSARVDRVALAESSKDLGEQPGMPVGMAG
jgi:hypothetical protein